MQLPSYKKLSLIIFFVSLTSNLNAQIRFEKGYFIDNSAQRIECFIKNMDWKKNPVEILYKVNMKAKESIAGIDEVKEFEIYGKSKYIRTDVNIDKSSKNLNNLSSNSAPVFEKENLLLKVLSEGKVSLYQYQDFNLTRYFYNPEGILEQLIFKSYSVKGKVAKNNAFRQQLWTTMKCGSLNVHRMKSIDYIKEDLLKFFHNYNKCAGVDSKTFEENQKRDLFNLTIRPRLNSSSLKVTSTDVSRNTEFDNELGFGLGIEAEYILPFNKNRWSIFLEPTYQSYKGEADANSTGFVAGPLKAKIEYSSIEIPIGLRHHFFIDNTSEIFIDVSYIMDASLGSSLSYTTATDIVLDDFVLRPNPNLALGLGYKFKNKFGLEFRYQTNRDVLGNLGFWNSKYDTLSFIFGYSIF